MNQREVRQLLPRASVTRRKPKKWNPNDVYRIRFSLLVSEIIPADATRDQFLDLQKNMIKKLEENFKRMKEAL